MRFRIKAITTSAILLILASLAMLGITYGWIAFGTNFTTNIINVGDLRYSETGAFIADDTVIVPGDELVATAFSLDNQSPITSQLRLKITYTRITNIEGVVTPEEDHVYKGDTDEHLAVTFDSVFTFTDGDATPGEYDDNYWYYISADEVIPATSGTIALFSELYYDGDKTSIDYNGQLVSVTVTVEVKQADNVTWSELATYDFSTGYPAA